MVVENGDRVRVTNLEKKTDHLAREVSTLGGEVHTHIKQVAAHRREAISENVTRDKLADTHHGEVMRGVNANAAELGKLVALDEDRGKRGGETTTFPMRLNGAKVPLAVGAVGGGPLMWAAYELYKALTS